jgi:hypothetical protein
VPRWLPRVLTRLRPLVAAGRVVLTNKARAELEVLGLQREDFLEILTSLDSGDNPKRVRSRPAGEWLYVFRPAVAGLRLYVKTAIRQQCVVLSCHEDRPDALDEADRDG